MAFKRRYRRKTRRIRRGKSRRIRRRTFRQRVVQVLNRKTETKYFDIGIQDQQLYHNLGYGTSLIPPTVVSALPLWFNPWINIQQGTARFNRIGDKVTPRGMRLKMFFANKADRPNTQIRLIVAILPKVFNGNLTTSNFDPFQIPNSGGVGNTMLFPADRDKGVKFLYDRIIRNGSQLAGREGTGGNKEVTRVVKLWIKRKRTRDILWDSTSSTLVNKPLAIYAIPYEQFDTLTTDKIATVSGFMRLYYKDT